jgi:hypothetical protein
VQGCRLGRSAAVTDVTAVVLGGATFLLPSSPAPYGGRVELALAALGVLLTAAGVGHQVWKARRRKQSDVTVKISYSLLSLPAGPVWAVLLEAINHGEHPVRVTGLGFDVQDRSGNTIQLGRIPPGATIPGEVKPHDSGQTWLIADRDVGEVAFDLFRPLVGWVRLATGDRIKSKPTTMLLQQ